MKAAIGLRVDYDARSLREIAKRSKDGPQARRLLALASIYDGGARSDWRGGRAGERGYFGNRTSRRLLRAVPEA